MDRSEEVLVKKNVNAQRATVRSIDLLDGGIRQQKTTLLTGTPKVT